MLSCWKRKKDKQRKYSDKKALMIGLNYPESYYSLKGCVNDVTQGSYYFQNLGYDVELVTDQNFSNGFDIIAALRKLGSGRQNKLIFHYSGHGTQVRDLNGDEIDRLDEALYLSEGEIITDDQINEVVSKYSSDKKIFMIWDCCHSGTIVDLPFVYTETGGVRREPRAKSIDAKIIAISGCQDPETSADVTKFFKSYGALSNTLYNILKKLNHKCSWKQLYQQLLVEMRHQGYQQYPVLSASNPSLFYEQVDFN